MVKGFLGAAAVAVVLFLGACSDTLGYGVVLWSLPDYGIEDTTVVPVYVKSSILKVYVIGVPDERGRFRADGEKIEVPIWKITEPASRYKARSLAKSYAGYACRYARVLLDGLPVRSHTVNTSRQVYRLRKGETIRVLYQGAGEAVYTGSTPLEGDWYRILTSDGTQGWCFSRYLHIYDSRIDNASDAFSAGNALAAEDLENVFDRPWYPEFYRAMIAGGKINLERLNPAYSFTVNTGRMMSYLSLPGSDGTLEEGKYAFTGVTENGGAYTLVGSPLIITPRGEADIIVSNVNDRGIPVSYNFVRLDKDLSDVIRDEKWRRQRIYEAFAKTGPVFTSDRYGTLAFTAPLGGADSPRRTDASDEDLAEPLPPENLTVTWTGNNALRPSFVSEGAGSAGVASFKYFLSDRMRTIYDGVITVTLENSDRENNFFYHILEGGIQLEIAGQDAPPDNTFTGRGMNPQVLLFESRGD